MEWFDDNSLEVLWAKWDKENLQTLYTRKKITQSWLPEKEWGKSVLQNTHTTRMKTKRTKMHVEIGTNHSSLALKHIFKSPRGRTLGQEAVLSVPLSPSYMFGSRI